MNTTTVANPTVPGFTWSYSVLKNFETCPKRYYHYNVAKDVVEPETEQLRAGNRLHAHFDARLRKGTKLPLGYGQYESLLARIEAAPGQTVAEQKLALNAQFGPAGWMGRSTWFRTVLDAGKIDGAVATVFDWKTGKVAEDLTQLQLMAATLFVHLPELERVRSALVFVNHEQLETAHFVRSDQTEIWGEILPRVRRVETARHRQEYPPTPSGLCKKYCAVVSCPYHGKGGR